MAKDVYGLPTKSASGTLTPGPTPNPIPSSSVQPYFSLEQKANPGSGDQTLYAYTMNPNTFSQRGDILHGRIYGEFADNTNLKVCQFFLGPNTNPQETKLLEFSSSTAGGIKLILEFDMIYAGDSGGGGTGEPNSRFKIASFSIAGTSARAHYTTCNYMAGQSLTLSIIANSAAASDINMVGAHFYFEPKATELDLVVGPGGFPTFGGFGLFARGEYTTTTYKYVFSGETVSAGTVLTGNVLSASGAGNTTVGIFALGNTNTTTNKYTYSGDTVAAGTVLSANSIRGAAAGTTTVGIFALGGNVTTTNKYTYSGDTVAAGTVLATATDDALAAGNTTVGIFAIGNSATTTNKYTYSGDVVAAGTALSGGAVSSAATGNSTVGIFAHGWSLTTTSKYTYSGDTVAAASAMPESVRYVCAAGNSSIGIFSNGESGSSPTFKYTFSTDSVTVATSLPARTTSEAATSSTPGHL